jgi:hypothetical protein
MRHENEVLDQSIANLQSGIKKNDIKSLISKTNDEIQLSNKINPLFKSKKNKVDNYIAANAKEVNSHFQGVIKNDSGKEFKSEADYNKIVSVLNSESGNLSSAKKIVKDADYKNYDGKIQALIKDYSKKGQDIVDNAKKSLQDTLNSASGLDKTSSGKVDDNATRAHIESDINNVNNYLKSNKLESAKLNDLKSKLDNDIKSINDSINTKNQKDAAAAQAAADAAAQAQAQSYTPSNNYTAPAPSYNNNSGGQSYSKPTAPAPAKPAPSNGGGSSYCYWTKDPSTGKILDEECFSSPHSAL